MDGPRRNIVLDLDMEIPILTKRHPYVSICIVVRVKTKLLDYQLGMIFWA